MIRKINLIGADGSQLLWEQHVRKIHFFGMNPEKINWSRAREKHAARSGNQLFP